MPSHVLFKTGLFKQPAFLPDLWYNAGQLLQGTQADKYLQWSSAQLKINAHNLQFPSVLKETHSGSMSPDTSAV